MQNLKDTFAVLGFEIRTFAIMYFDVHTLDDFDKKQIGGLSEAHVLFMAGEDPEVDDFDEED